MKGLLQIFIIGVISSSIVLGAAIPEHDENDKQPLLNYTECNGHLFGDTVPFNNDCGKFIVCMSNTTNEGFNETCSNGLHFNPELQVCDYPLRANCEWFNINNFLGDNDCYGRTDGDLVAYPNDCTKFVYCTIGEEGTTGIPIDCPSDDDKGSLHFNPIKKVCDWPASAGCLLKE